MSTVYFPEIKKYIGCAAIGLALLSGCKSAQDKAIDQAKQQAAATGQPQQVTSTDKNGTTTITTVQPPAPGQTSQQITTVTQPASAVPASTPATADGTPAPATAGAPAPGAPPVIQPANIDIAAGTPLTIRINQHISVKTTPPGAAFSGEVAEAVSGRDGRVAIPRGTVVHGVVDASHERGHFKGSSILELRLTSMDLNGQSYNLATRDFVRTKKGKGKRTAAMIGGGSGLGMLVGGVATGGVGLLVGGLVGAGAGTAVAGTTGNRDINLPAESLVTFKLQQDLAVDAN